MFIDSANVHVKAGRGGDGAVAFRREKFAPQGGPSGGDGGNGGSIVFVGDSGLRTLMDFRYQRSYAAENGENGQNKNQYGKAGANTYLRVPLGTLIKDKESGKVMADIRKNGEEFVVVKGGRGGKGNSKFATATRQAPRFSQPGTKGEERDVVLELKLIADIGLIGMPNVGKSSLLSIMSNATPKIANYHFTTLAPNLGVVELSGGRSFVLADIPGLIEGAGEGAGLGHDFLRHIERTRMLAHVVDISGSEDRDPRDDFRMINQELEEYNPRLAEKHQVVVLNKIDLPDSDFWMEYFLEDFGEDYEIIETSAATTQGVEDLKEALWKAVESLESDYETYDEEYDFFQEKEVPEYEVFVEDGVFFVEGPFVEQLVHRTNFEDYQSLSYFLRALKQKGIIEELEDLGLTDGSDVVVDGMEFEYRE